MSQNTVTPVIPAAPAAATGTPVVPAAVVAPVVPAAPAPVVAATPPATLEEALAEAEKWKGHARTWEDRAAENKAAKGELDKIAAEKLTTEQRLEKERDDALAELNSSRTEALRNGVAATKGVPVALLTGTTQAELEQAADALLAFRGNVTPPANDTTASGAQGAPVIAGAQITSRAQLSSMSPAEIVAARKEGRLTTLLGAQAH